METNLRKTIQKVILAAFQITLLALVQVRYSSAQMLDMMEEAEVRNPDDFIGRFNMDASSEFIKFAVSKSPDGKLLRREILSLLFNRNQEWNDTMRIEFVNYIDNKYSPRFFNISKDSILAEINTIAEINGENSPVKFILCFHSELNKQRWEIVNIQSPVFSDTKIKWDNEGMMSEQASRLHPDSATLELKYFIVPSDHNIDFMNMDELFKSPHFLYYCSAVACENNMNMLLFNHLIKTGKVKFREKKSIHFHFTSWPLWTMKVSYVSNAHTISGWLITGLYKDPEKKMIHSLLKN